MCILLKYVNGDVTGFVFSIYCLDSEIYFFNLCIQIQNSIQEIKFDWGLRYVFNRWSMILKVPKLEKARQRKSIDAHCSASLR